MSVFVLFPKDEWQLADEKTRLDSDDYFYPQMSDMKYRTSFHDRFLIVDEDVYHIGASLKDLGKRLFAFDKMGLSKDLILSQVR